MPRGKRHAPRVCVFFFDLANLHRIAMRASPHAALRASAHVPRTSRHPPSRPPARTPAPPRALSALSSSSASSASSAPRVAMAFWNAGAFDAAESAFESHLEAHPLDVTTWIAYAQMQKKVRAGAGERPTARLHPGLQSDSDVRVSKASVFRARRVLYRAIDACAGEPTDARDACATRLASRASLLQALGLLELTHGYEMYGSTLLEMAVKSQPKLTPVLRWRRVRCARAAHVVAGAGRVRKMRESLRNRFEV